MRLKLTDNSKRCILTYLINGIPTEIPGLIIYESGSFFFLNNHATFDGGNHLLSMYGFKYAYNLGMKGDSLVGSGFVGFRFNESNVIFKKDASNGFLFRRLHKELDGLVFIGPIKKDPEECKNPSSVITTADYGFLKSKGWAIYETEISAEQRLEMASKRTK